MENGVSYYDFPMKWHKFLIYFALWAGTLLNLISGIRLMTGMIYDGAAATVYGVYPMMRPVDLVFGAVMAAHAVFQIVTRFALAQLRKCGPKLVVVSYICGPAAGLMYLLAASAASGIGLRAFFDFSTIIEIVISAVIAFATHAYYQRRAAVFVN